MDKYIIISSDGSHIYTIVSNRTQIIEAIKENHFADNIDALQVNWEELTGTFLWSWENERHDGYSESFELMKLKESK